MNMLKSLCKRIKGSFKSKDDVSKLDNTVDYIERNEYKSDVIVVETGYLMTRGITDIMNESLKIFVPQFCINELNKLSRDDEEAKKIFAFFYAKEVLNPIDLRNKEVVFKESPYKIKDRSRGVVALCCYLVNKGYKVHLKTNSFEIANLARNQNCIDICVEKIEN